MSSMNGLTFEPPRPCCRVIPCRARSCVCLSMLSSERNIDLLFSLLKHPALRSTWLPLERCVLPLVSPCVVGVAIGCECNDSSLFSVHALETPVSSHWCRRGNLLQCVHAGRRDDIGGLLLLFWAFRPDSLCEMCS